MQKKSLGRGFEEISNIFLSADEEKESEQCGVRSLDAIGSSYAKNREHFRPFALGEIDKHDAGEAGYSHQAENQCEVEETGKIRKTIAIQNDEKAQQNMRSVLSSHLKEGYGIRRVELKKIEENSGPRNKVRIEKDVSIFIKGFPSP